MKKTYNIVIIGGGPAGLAAAISAVDSGVKDVLIFISKVLKRLVLKLKLKTVMFTQKHQNLLVQIFILIFHQLVRLKT